jgi:hypothetical protein
MVVKSMMQVFDWTTRLWTASFPAFDDDVESQL